ncbi:MAG: hypothetical protein HRU06_15675 [Oceanospirillaceae bacterium]|nr:hypothetical protein [Oceanospirillaceae bacterium]
MRGGCWNNNTNRLRCSSRNRRQANRRNNNSGFRLIQCALITRMLTLKGASSAC